MSSTVEMKRVRTEPDPFAQALPPVARERPLILVVEDDLSTQEALLDLLLPTLDAVAASDGDAALTVAREHRPDVILMDLGLPKRDGVSAFEELHKDARTRGVPVIFVSGSNDESTVARCLELGGEDFLTKPAGPRELLARIERSLRHARERRELEALAQLDALTGLYNFRSLNQRIDLELARAQRYGHSLAAIMLDLDHLKEINDRFGHEMGNEAIRRVAAQVKRQMREVDFAARYGGDEFAILLPHQTAAESAILAQRILSGVAGIPIDTPQGPHPMTLSIGIAAHGKVKTYASSTLLLEAADSALNQAKQQGRNRIVLASVSE